MRYVLLTGGVKFPFTVNDSLESRVTHFWAPPYVIFSLVLYQMVSGYLVETRCVNKLDELVSMVSELYDCMRLLTMIQFHVYFSSQSFLLTVCQNYEIKCSVFCCYIIMSFSDECTMRGRSMP